MGQKRHQTACWIWGIFAILLTIMGMLVAFVTPGPNSSNTIWNWILLGIAFGFPFGAVSALSIWTALETCRYRILLSICFNVAIATQFTVFVVRTGGPWSAVVSSCVTLTLLNIVVQGPLWFLRLRSGYQLRDVETSEPSEQNPPQFSIGNMLAFTTLSAMITAGGKLLVPWVQDNAGSSANQVFGFAMMFLLFGICAATTTLGALWISTTRKLFHLSIVIAIWGGLVAASALQIRSLSRGTLTEAISFSVSCNMIAALMVCAPLYVLHAFGRRKLVAE